MRSTAFGAWRDRLRGNGWDDLALAGIALGALLRLLFVLVHPPEDYIYSDMQGYVERAVRLASGSPLERSDAFYPPGTHALLAVPLGLLGTGAPGLRGAAWFWWALSALTPFAAWKLARALLSPAAAALTAVLCALSPLLVAYAGFFTSETPALALLLGALWLGYRAAARTGLPAFASGLMAGLLGGGAIAHRPQFVLNLLVLAVPLAWRGRPRRPAALGLGLGVAAVIAATIAYNSAATGSLTGLSENGGLIFFQTHCDVRLVSAGPPGKEVVFGNPVQGQLDRGEDRRFPNHDVSDQGFFYAEGRDCISDDGIAHAVILARGLLDATATTVPWPPSNEATLGRVADVANVLTSVALPFVLLGAVALVRRRRRAGLPWRAEAALLAHLLCFLPVALIFAPEPRLRIPYDVFLYALGAALVVDRLGRTSPASPPRADAAPPAAS